MVFGPTGNHRFLGAAGTPQINEIWSAKNPSAFLTERAEVGPGVPEGRSISLVLVFLRFPTAVVWHSTGSFVCALWAVSVCKHVAVN